MVFFDSLGIRFEYEKEGYSLGEAGWYLPDFWLPTVYLRSYPEPGLWVEIKGAEPTDLEHERCSILASGTAKPVILFVGLPGDRESSLGGYQFTWDSWDNYMGFVRCALGHIRVDFSNYWEEPCPFCKAPASANSARMEGAYIAARQARFER